MELAAGVAEAQFFVQSRDFRGRSSGEVSRTPHRQTNKQACSNHHAASANKKKKKEAFVPNSKIEILPANHLLFIFSNFQRGTASHFYDCSGPHSSLHRRFRLRGGVKAPGIFDPLKSDAR